MDQYVKKTAFGDQVTVHVHQSPSSDAIAPVHPPTTVFFGWYAAHPRHLAKYASIFQNLGYNTVQSIGPFSAIYAHNPFRQARYVHSVLSIVAADDRLTHGGTIYVFMSTAGALCSTQLTRMFQGHYESLTTGENGRVVDSIKATIAAVLFESAPCYIHNHVAANAVIEGLGISDGSVLSWLISRLFDLYLWFQRRFLSDIPTLFWMILRNADYRCPEQYIYSSSDRFMDAERLEALIEERRKKGKEIYILRVDDADHVQILRSHPKLYKDTMEKVNEWGVNMYRRRVGLGEWIVKKPNAAM